MQLVYSAAPADWASCVQKQPKKIGCVNSEDAVMRGHALSHRGKSSK